MSKATPGPGFLLQKGDGATPENFTTVAEVRDIKGPSIKTDLHEVTNQSSAGGYEEHVPTIRRSGTVSFPVNLIPTDPTHNSSTGFIADLNNKTLRNWKLLDNDGFSSVVTFKGYVVDFEQTMPVAGVLTGEVSIKVVGQPVFP